MALVVKNLPANAGDVKDMGLIPRLGKSHGGENVSHCSIFARIIPWTEDLVGQSPQGQKEGDTTERLSTYCFDRENNTSLTV